MTLVRRIVYLCFTPNGLNPNSSPRIRVFFLQYSPKDIGLKGYITLQIIQKTANEIHSIINKWRILIFKLFILPITKKLTKNKKINTDQTIKSNNHYYSKIFNLQNITFLFKTHKQSLSNNFIFKHSQAFIYLSQTMLRISR